MKMTLDPNDKYGHSPQSLLGACGLIPTWFLQAYANPKIRCAIDVIDTYYGYGDWATLAQYTKFDIADDYSLHHPGDPGLQPIITFNFCSDSVSVYPHAYVRINNEVARID